MNKEQFLKQLKRTLSGIPEAEREEILYDYEEHFRNAREDGQDEEQIAASLGNPKVLGKSYRIESLLDGKRGGPSASNILRAVFASLSLGFLNVIITIPLFAGLLGGLAGLWAGAVSLAVSGIAIILGAILQPLFPAFISLGGLSVAFLIFAGIGIAALGLLAVLGMWKLSQLFFRLAAGYVRFNIRIIKRQEVRA